MNFRMGLCEFSQGEFLFLLLPSCFSCILNVSVFVCAEFLQRGIYRIQIHTYSVTVTMFS